MATIINATVGVTVDPSEIENLGWSIDAESLAPISGERQEDLCDVARDIAKKIPRGATVLAAGPGAYIEHLCKQALSKRWELLEPIWDGTKIIGLCRPIEIIITEAEQFLLSWKDETTQRLNELHREIKEAHPDAEPIIASIQARRERAQCLLKRAYKDGGGSKKYRWKDLEQEAADLEIPGLLKAMQQQREQGQKAAARYRDSRQKIRNGQSLTTVCPRKSSSCKATKPVQGILRQREAPPPTDRLHPNDIRGLAPQSSWTLLLDETGSDFGGDIRSKGLSGKFVGLLVPDNGNCLHPLKSGWHAIDCVKTDDIDQVVQAVLDAPCGVLGITTSALPEDPNERWFDGMLGILEWVLRLLPLKGHTKLNVAIEARPPFKPGQYGKAVVRDVVAHLARAWPDRAKLLEVSLKVIGKDGHPLNGYVDALAFTWGSQNPASRERLKCSGLEGTCLLNVTSRDLAASWDAWDQPGGLSPLLWRDLASSPDGPKPNTITHAILSSLSDKCKRDVSIWQTYLDEAKSHLYGGAFNVTTVGRMVEWLEAAAPDASAIPPAIRLAWLTAKLAGANHVGKTESKWLQELNELSEKLREEDASVCCFAALHIAVSATNRFDFDTASKVLEEWSDLPPSIPGLRLWGQVKSSIGQHLAFAGKLAKAREAFSEALRAFARLSDPSVRAQELSQTSCYYSITMMDDTSVSDAEAYAALSEYLGNPETAAESYATLTDDGTKFMHHTLLRYLVFRGNQTVKDKYLKHQRSWECGTGHPWPLINAYRAILLRNRDNAEAQNLILDARDGALCPTQGATMHLIGSVLGAVGLSWGVDWPDAEGVLERLTRELPFAAASIQVIQDSIHKPVESTAIMRAALPFNFR